MLVTTLLATEKIPIAIQLASHMRKISSVWCVFVSPSPLSVCIVRPPHRGLCVSHRMHFPSDLRWEQDPRGGRTRDQPIVSYI
jgi:hypothetical protein